MPTNQPKPFTKPITMPINQPELFTKLITMPTNQLKLSTMLITVPINQLEPFITLVIVPINLPELFTVPTMLTMLAITMPINLVILSVKSTLVVPITISSIELNSNLMELQAMSRYFELDFIIPLPVLGVGSPITTVCSHLYFSNMQ